MSKLIIVSNNQKYFEFIRQLRNHKKLKKGFIQQKHVSKSQHLKYMKKNKQFYYICLLNNQPVGYIGIIDNDIRVATHPDFHGQGIALFMVKFIKKKFKKAQAKIKISNQASIRLFEKAGFKLKYYLYE